MTLLFMTLLLAGALGAAAAPQPGTKTMGPPGKPVVDASFQLRAPEGWSVEKKPGGAVLTGPAAEGLPARVILRYVRPGHALYADPHAYMARLTKPSSIPMKGWKNGPVEKTVAAGRRALRLERDTTEFIPPESMASKEVAVREEHLAVYASAGFYLLVYSAPRSIDAAQRRVWRGIVAGFKPKF
ncbi:MAG TPA: hypothetical protein DCZ01_10960 [Elusimicrobia bacterium]|nr:MAG: hypothetical protein A2X37_01950 [Elusimicrobia bacterium GWA2_66_18]OGR77423.1 MAG: hypothetical protein A2X40_11225 [Elusimicrobia bacterium GWC2_65_9]HAZ09010.1 hypothetical protein [Elusimicrobiota bacterium]